MKKKKTLKKTLNPYMITFGAVLGASSLGLGIYYGVYEKYYYEPKTILDQIQNLKNDANLNYFFSDELNQLQQDYENIKKTKSNEPIFDGLQQQINRLVLKQQLIKKDENNIVLNNNEKTYLGNYINTEFEEILKYVDKNNPESYYSYLDPFYQKSIDNFIKQSQTSKGKSKHDFRNLLIQYYHTEKGVLQKIKDTKQKIQSEIDVIKELLQNVNDTSKRKQKILLNLNTNILDKIKQQKILAQQLKDQVDLYNQNLNQIIDVNVNNTQLEYWSTQLSYYEGINQKINLLNHHNFNVSDFKQLSFMTIKKSTILNDVNHKFYDEVIKNNYDKNDAIQYFLAYEYQIKNDDLGIVSKVFKKLIPLEYDGTNNQVYLEFKQTHPKFYANYKNKFDIKEQYFYVENDAFLKESFVRKEIVKLKDYYDNERKKSIDRFNNLLIKIENTNFKKIDEFNTKSFNRWKSQDDNPVNKLTTYLDDLKTNRFIKGDDATWYRNWNDDYIDNNDLIINTIENNYVRLVNLLINNQFYTNLYINQKNKIATIQHKTIEEEKTWKTQNPDDKTTIFLHNNTFLQSSKDYVRDRSFNINDPNQTFTKTLTKNNDTIDLLDENKINNLQLLTSNLENNSFYDLLKQFIVAYDRVLDWYNANNKKLIISKLSNRPKNEKTPQLQNINLVELKSFSDLFFYKESTNEHNETTKSIDQSQDIIKLYFDGILNTKQMQDLETNLNNAVVIINQGVRKYNEEVYAKLNEYNWSSKYDHETIFYNELIKQLNSNVSLTSLETTIQDYLQHIENNNKNIKLKSDVTIELDGVNTASLNINYNRQLYNNNENNPNSYNQKIINKHNDLKTQLENYNVDSLYTNKSQLLTTSTYLNNLRNIIKKTNDSIQIVNTFKTNPFNEISLTLNQNVDPNTHPNKRGQYTKAYMLSLSNQQLKSKVQETTSQSSIFNIDDINHMYYLKDNQKWNYIALETYINGINENKQIKKDFVLQRNDLVFFDNPMEVSVFVTKNINIEENGFNDGDIEVIKETARNIKDIFNLQNYNQTQLNTQTIFNNYKKWILLNYNQGLENVSNTQLLDNQTNLLQSMRFLTSKTINNIRDYSYQDFLILKNFLETNTINRNNNTLYSDDNLKSKYNGNILNRFITNEDVKSFIKGMRKNFVDPFTNIRWNGYWDYNFTKSEYKPKLDDKFNQWIYTNPFIKNVIYNNNISEDDKTKMLLYYIVNQLPITPDNNPFDTKEKMKTTLKSLYTNQNHLFVIDNPNDNKNTKTYDRLYNHLKRFYKFNIKMYANPTYRADEYYKVDNIEFEYSVNNNEERPNFIRLNVGKLLEDLYKKSNEMDTLINLYDILLKPNYHSFNNLTAIINANKEKTLFNKTTNNGNWEYYNLRLEKNNNPRNNPNFNNLFNPYGFKYLLNIHITNSQSTYDALFNNLDLWHPDGKITSYQQLINIMELKPSNVSGNNLIIPQQYIDNVKRRLLDIQTDYKKLLNYTVNVENNHYSIVYDNDHVLFSGANFDNKLITLLENDSNNVANAKKLKNPVLYKFQPLIWIPSQKLHYNASVLINNNFRISDLLKSKNINIWRNVFNVSEPNPNYTEINKNASILNTNFISKWDKEYDEPNGWNNLIFNDETDYDYGINTIDHLFSVNHYIKNNKVFNRHILPYTYSANNYSLYKSLFSFINTYPNDFIARMFNLWGSGSSYNSN